MLYLGGKLLRQEPPEGRQRLVRLGFRLGSLGLVSYLTNEKLCRKDIKICINLYKDD